VHSHSFLVSRLRRGAHALEHSANLRTAAQCFSQQPKASKLPRGEPKVIYTFIKVSKSRAPRVQ
jgi:hypothetical protein